MKIIQIILTMLLLIVSSCKTSTPEPVYVPVEKIRIVKEVIRDTIVQVKLIPYYKSAIAIDKPSYLENEYAYSNAWWDGSQLHHDLGIFDREIPTRILYRDRHVTDTIPKPYPVYVDKHYITGLDNFQIWCGRILIVMVVGYLGFKYIRRFI